MATNPQDMYGMNIKGSDGKNYYVVYRSPNIQFNSDLQNRLQAQEMSNPQNPLAKTGSVSNDFNNGPGLYSSSVDFGGPVIPASWQAGSKTINTNTYKYDTPSIVPSRAKEAPQFPLTLDPSANYNPQGLSDSEWRNLPLNDVTGPVARQIYPTTGSYLDAMKNQVNKYLNGNSDDSTYGVPQGTTRSAFSVPLNSSSFYASSTLPNWPNRQENINYYNQYGGTSPKVQSVGYPTLDKPKYTGYSTSNMQVSDPGKPIQDSGNFYTGQVPLNYNPPKNKSQALTQRSPGIVNGDLV